MQLLCVWKRTLLYLVPIHSSCRKDIARAVGICFYIAIVQKWVPNFAFFFCFLQSVVQLETPSIPSINKPSIMLEFNTYLFRQQVHINLIKHIHLYHYFPDIFRRIGTIFTGYLANCVFKTQSSFRSQMHSIKPWVYRVKWLNKDF